MNFLFSIFPRHNCGYDLWFGIGPLGLCQRGSDTLAVSILLKYNTNINQTAWVANWGCELGNNPSYNESDEIMVSFMMYTVSDSDK